MSAITAAAARLALAGAMVTAAATPAHGDAVREAQWFASFMDLPQARQLSTGSGVVVGIPDSGVSPHPDLAGNLLDGTDTAPGGDDAGHVDRIGHGTEMAGLIAGHGRAGDAGVTGVATAARILPIKSFTTTDHGSGLAPGIRWAAENGAAVISVSAAVAPSNGLSDAVAAAARHDAVVVASSGNRSADLLLGHPAAMPGVLAVGAIGRDGAHAPFSVTGPQVALCAPGVDIVTTGLNGQYRRIDGTSAAAAIVSGAAALVRSRFPELTAPEVVHRLTATATDIGPPGRDDQCGFGVLDIVEALTADLHGENAAPAPFSSENAAPAPLTSPAGNRPAPAAALAAAAALAGVGFLALRHGRRRVPRHRLNA